MGKKIIETAGHADLTLGARMRMARLSVGLFLSDAAKEVGVTKQAVGHWEMDRSEPPVSALQKLAKLYEINLMWLIAGKGTTSPAASAAAAGASPDRQAELLETIRTMRNAGLVVTRVVLEKISIEIEISAAVNNGDNSRKTIDRRGPTNAPHKKIDQLIVDARK